ncbi:hypothetical protein BDP27DRAFT_1405995 [Rhodocollybia butyracea]|uniref:Uncharacterized protein n=1 Tax=Rhodocollybia butyracea TaxID=206335 RepID=A0A9P5U2T5_9AGAR|nr:hypothetical protein BDP27DRAFT_1405995 [Rhodocollybia butyracea]
MQNWPVFITTDLDGQSKPMGVVDVSSATFGTASGNLYDISRNGFIGMSLANINAFIRTRKDVLEKLELSPYKKSFVDAWSMTANLDIANMGFEDFVDEEAGAQEDGMWKWQPFDGESKEREREVDV